MFDSNRSLQLMSKRGTEFVFALSLHEKFGRVKVSFDWCQIKIFLRFTK